MRFEMDVEVRPDFALPNYKGLKVKRPVKTITDADVEGQMTRFLERYAQLVPKFEGGAELGDFVTADLHFHDEGKTLNEAKEVQFRLQPELRFQDGSVPDVATALAGVKPGETREADAKIGSGSPDPGLRGKTIRVTFLVHDLKSLRLPEVTPAFLASIGFDTEDDLRSALRQVLVRRLDAAATRGDPRRCDEQPDRRHPVRPAGRPGEAAREVDLTPARLRTEGARA